MSTISTGVTQASVLPSVISAVTPPPATFTNVLPGTISLPQATMATVPQPPVVVAPVVAPVVAEPVPLQVKSSFTTHTIPWPMIILLIIVLIAVIFVAVARNTTNDLKILSIVVLLVWGFSWAVILWILWRRESHILSWVLMVVAVIVIAIYIVVVIIL